MKTFLQKLLVGNQGQVVGFGPDGRAIAVDPVIQLGAQIVVTVVRGAASGVVTLTATNAGKTVISRVPVGEHIGILNINAYGTWKVTAKAENGDLLSSTATVNVDTLKQYPLTVGVSSILSENSPKGIGEASNYGIADKYWKTGDETSLVLTTGETIPVVICGMKHDDLTGGGKAGITFAMTDVMATKRQMTDTGEDTVLWANSTLKATLDGLIYNSLPADWKSVIKTVDKLTMTEDRGGGDYDVTSVPSKLWLFSCSEMKVSAAKSPVGEGTAYPYLSFKKKTQDWWLRSCPFRNGIYNYTINTSQALEGDPANLKNGVAFGFCV